MSAIHPGTGTAPLDDAALASYLERIGLGPPAAPDLDALQQRRGRAPARRSRSRRSTRSPAVVPGLGAGRPHGEDPARWARRMVLRAQRAAPPGAGRTRVPHEGARRPGPLGRGGGRSPDRAYAHGAPGRPRRRPVPGRRRLRRHGADRRAAPGARHRAEDAARALPPARRPGPRPRRGRGVDGAGARRRRVARPVHGRADARPADRLRDGQPLPGHTPRVAVPDEHHRRAPGPGPAHEPVQPDAHRAPLRRTERADRPRLAVGGPGRAGGGVSGSTPPASTASTPGSPSCSRALSDAEAEGAQLLAAVLGDLLRTPRRHPDPVDPDVVDQPAVRAGRQSGLRLLLDHVGQRAGGEVSVMSTTAVEPSRSMP